MTSNVPKAAIARPNSALSGASTARSSLGRTSSKKSMKATRAEDRSWSDKLGSKSEGDLCNDPNKANQPLDHSSFLSQGLPDVVSGIPSTLSGAISSESWLGLMSDLPFDSSNEKEDSAPISPTKWWEMRLVDNPSDETDPYELEAASFDVNGRKKIVQNHEKVDMKRAKKPVIKTPKALKAPKQRPIAASHSIDTAFHNSPYPGFPSKQTGTAIDGICKGGSAILDLIEKNVCSTDFLDSPSMQKVENKMNMVKLEEQLEKMNHPALWKILGKNMNDDEIGPDSESDEDSSSCPPSPENSVSFSEVDNLISDLENDVLFVKKQQRRNNHNLRRELQIKMMPHRLERGKNCFDSAQHVNTTTGTSQDKEGVLKLQLQPMMQKAQERKRTSTYVPPSELKKGSRSSGIPATVSTDLQENHGTNLDQISILTEERSPFMYLGLLEERRSCVPAMSTLVKKIKNIKRTATSLPSPKQSLESRKKGKGSKRIYSDPTGSRFLYGYENASHAYVAYFERGVIGSESIKMFEHPTPPMLEKLDSEAVVVVDASSVSRTDCFIRRAEWWGKNSQCAMNLPIIPGTAFMGRVDSEGVGGPKVNERVVSLVRSGANSRHLITDADRLVKIPPENLNDAAITCLPELYMAAFQSLHHGQKNHARYKRNSLFNKKILILGGATLTGRAAIEVSKAAGAEAVYATGREKDFGRIGDVGGLPLSKDPRHWLSILKGKMDLIISFDGPYGSPQLKYEHVQTLCSNGKIVVIGGPEQGDKSVVDLGSIDGTASDTKRKLYNYNVFDSWDNDPKQAKKDLTHLLKLLREGNINPVIIERLPLEKVAKAHDFLDIKNLRGFVLCEPWITGKKEKLEKSMTEAADDNNAIPSGGEFPTSEVLW